MAIQVDVAELAGLVVEGCLYGAFMVLFFISFHTLVKRKKRSKLSPAMIVAAVTMAVLATCQIIVDTVNIFWAFIPLTREERIIFLTDVTHPIFAAKHAIYFTMMLVGDAIVTHRAYVVWDRNYWVIIVPAICSLGSAVCAYQTIFAVRHIATTTIAAQASWGIALFSLSLAANSISTSLISYKIWTHDKKTRRVFFHGTTVYGGQNLMPVVRVIAESGAVNAAYLLAYLVVLVKGTHALEIMAGISTPLIGILFGTVIIRATMSSQHNSTMQSTNRSTAVAIPMVVQSQAQHNQTAVRVNVEYDWSDNTKEFQNGRKIATSSNSSV
ncbi:hypothetical protein BDQ17DRAFT_1370452 [Cyathus striatus]|nr:hypothetical protein BDQ17DRAFT_1370452 [Cyathus striatus]